MSKHLKAYPETATFPEQAGRELGITGDSHSQGKVFLYAAADRLAAARTISSGAGVCPWCLFRAADADDVPVRPFPDIALTKRLHHSSFGPCCDSYLGPIRYS